MNSKPLFKTDKPTFKPDSEAIADRTLWDSLGNSCRITMYRYGHDTFELYTQVFNSSVPGRFIGSLGDCNARAERWIATVKEAGFVEQLPSYEPNPIA